MKWLIIVDNVVVDNEEHITENEDIEFLNWSPYLIDIMKYISGLIARKIANVCEIVPFVQMSYVQSFYLEKNSGGLLHVSSSNVIKTCKIVEDALRSTLHSVANKML